MSLLSVLAMTWLILLVEYITGITFHSLLPVLTMTADAPGLVHNRHHIQFIITCSRYDIADAPH